MDLARIEEVKKILQDPKTKTTLTPLEIDIKTRVFVIFCGATQNKEWGKHCGLYDGDREGIDVYQKVCRNV